MPVLEVTQETVADKFVWGLWRSIDEDYKNKYFQEIWQHFENAIKSASYTDSLKKFLDNIKTRIPITIQAKYQKDMMEIVESGKDELIMDWLRTETTYLIMLCRVANQERKELYSDERV